MVPLEYALVSLMSGLDQAWASVVMGLLYLLQLPLVVFLLSRRFGGFDDFRGAFVLLMAPLAVMWAAWYIPQVYSLTLFLTAFLAGSALLQIPLLTAGVFGHGASPRGWR
jgi:Kef-type K+ transport system membrane component KefB